MKHFLFVVLALALWQSPYIQSYAIVSGQPAPEITGQGWINSEPLTMAGLRGRVVLVEFWTYG